ncbi:hypothetical protein [Kitasatospora mediocidica]|uniref:hypothetical protein n=1 Tax=Kitasatospora mediocidica TaxID=58352 RepID=UPI0005674B25|nr:hypothetical protein [Kitasatospora mediocidica]
MTDAEVLLAAVKELGERPSGLPVSCNPLIAAILTRWARMAGLDPDPLHRVGGPETVALARAITGDQT